MAGRLLSYLYDMGRGNDMSRETYAGCTLCLIRGMLYPESPRYLPS